LFTGKIFSPDFNKFIAKLCELKNWTGIDLNGVLDLMKDTMQGSPSASQCHLSG